MLFVVLLSACWSESYTEPRIRFEADDTFKLPADSLEVNQTLNLDLYCESNGNDLLTRLYISTNNELVLEDISMRPPTAAFGYKFKFDKTEAKTDSIIFELHDKNGNIGKYFLMLYKKE